MHEEQAKRPLDDNELQVVVGGTGSNSSSEQMSANLNVEELMIMMRQEHIAVTETAMRDKIGQMEARNETISALNDSVSGLQVLLGGFTDDQGNVDPQMTISLDQVHDALPGLDGLLAQQGLGDLDRDQSGAISADELTTMIGAAQDSMNAGFDAQHADMQQYLNLRHQRDGAVDVMNQMMQRMQAAGVKNG